MVELQKPKTLEIGLASLDQLVKPLMLGLAALVGPSSSLACRHEGGDRGAASASTQRGESPLEQLTRYNDQREAEKDFKKGLDLVSGICHSLANMSLRANTQGERALYAGDMEKQVKELTYYMDAFAEKARSYDDNQREAVLASSEKHRREPTRVLEVHAALEAAPEAHSSGSMFFEHFGRATARRELQAFEAKMKLAYIEGLDCNLQIEHLSRVLCTL